MKLALRREDSFAVLEITGGVDEHNLEVIKAGLSKLLQNGQNRIVLFFPEADASGIESAVMRELAILDVFARELAGQIVIASPSPELKESVTRFAKPPVIPIVADLELAREFFQRLNAPAEEARTEAETLQKQLEVKSGEVRALEARLKQLDPAQLDSLRAENATLRAKLGDLEIQVERLTLEKRKPVDTAGLLEKIDTLEQSLTQLAKADA